MKTKNLILILLAIIVGFTSCEPENKDLPPEGTIEYNSTNYSITKGAFIDNGSSNYYGTVDTHYDYDFYITDGAFVYDNTGEIMDVNGKIVIAAYLGSFGSSSFKTGTYTFIDDSNDGSLTDSQLKSKYENKSFFYEAGIAVSSNINSSLLNAEEYYVKSGTIRVEGTKPNYTLTYDWVLEDGKTVKGSYSGTFKEAY